VQTCDVPRPALTDKQRRETRLRNFTAAAELCAENGFRDISARTIADKAGVSVGTLYTNFDNLKDLMQSL
jgi:AcrR family transcriptional regulator